MADGLSRVQQIGQALGGFGAGIQGNLPQFQAAQSQRRQLEAQETERQRLAQIARQQQIGEFTARAAQQGLRLINNGDYDQAIGLSKLVISKFSEWGLDPSGAQRISALLTAAGNGSNEAKKLVISELTTQRSAGELGGFIEPPEAKEGFTLAKGAQRFGPGGELIAENIPEDDPAKRETAVDINGVRRFIDTGETVFSEVEEVTERDIEEDVNGVKRFVDTGEVIFPGVTPLEEPETPEKLTSSQRLAAGFAQRTTVSGRILSELGDQFIGFLSRGVGIVPQGLRGEDRQRFDQATEDFINATLRRESGAAIAPSEFVSANSQYIPQVGDKEAVLEQKRKNREVISASLQLEAGEAFLQLQDVLAQETVIVLGQEYEVGQIVENEDGQQGRIEADGSITPL